jgi:hypothetical protein
VESDVIEREEWLILLGMVADVRRELEVLTDFLTGGADGEEEGEDET